MHTKVDLVLYVYPRATAAPTQHKFIMLWPCRAVVRRQMQLHELCQRISSGLHLVFAPAVERCNSFPTLGRRRGYCSKRKLPDLNGENRLFCRVLSK